MGKLVGISLCKMGEWKHIGILGGFQGWESFDCSSHLVGGCLLFSRNNTGLLKLMDMWDSVVYSSVFDLGLCQ